MSRMQFAVVLAAVVGLGNGWSPWPPAMQGLAQAVDSSAAEAPPSPWLQGDPADSLYRAAREALNRRDFEAAARMFAAIPDRFPRSGYAADAYYWRAFALYRLGGEARLREALAALRTQEQRFPKAGTKGDAKALEGRIRGELARTGDPEMAESVLVQARQLAPAAPPSPPSPPAGVEPPEPPDPPEPPSRSRDCDDDSDDKLAALNALIHMNPDRARPILQKVLARRDAASSCLREKAVFLVAQGGGDGVEKTLIDVARADPDPRVREQAVFWLSQVGTDAAVVALDSILRLSKDRGVQEKAVFALSQHDGPRARQALRTYAERADLPSDLREKAIFWIGQSGGAENEAFLRSLFGRLKEEELRKKVLFSISQAGGRENEQWLLGVARDRAQPLEIRKKALFWLGQSDDPRAAQALQDIIDQP